MNQIDTFDPKDVTVTVGTSLLSGFAESVVRVSRESNQVEDEVGADGDVARRITNDRRGSIVISLLQTSRANAILAALARADELTGTVIFPVTIKDQRGNDLVVAASAWVQKHTDMSYRSGIETREWTLRSNNVQMFAGGAA